MTIEISYQQTLQNYASYFTQPIILTIVFTKEEQEPLTIETTAQVLPLAKEVEGE